METDAHRDQPAWPMRAAALALAGAVIGTAQSVIVSGWGRGQDTDDPLRLGIAVFLVVGGLAFGFTIERMRPSWSAAFAVAGGLLVGLVTYWNGPGGNFDAGNGWQYFCALLTVAIAAPFVQVARDRGGWSTDYSELYANAWTNVVLWFAALIFTLIVYGLAHLLAALFGLIGIDLLRDLLRKDWFGWLVMGGAFGAAVGLLRDRARILVLMQRVVLVVLSVLAPVLGAGLLLFLLALPFTGLDGLWESTRSTTPILLGCIIGAVILANAVIGDGLVGEDGDARPSVLRWAALALGASILPLASIAAISTGTRIAQYGFTPDRLWAAVFVAIAVAYGLAYPTAVLRARRNWPEATRSTNVRLGLGLLVAVMLLATPIFDFGGLTARDQVSRLNSGKTKIADFDWRALRFDFGPAGRRELERLAKRGASPEVRRLAMEAGLQTSRYKFRKPEPGRAALADSVRAVRILPVRVPIPTALARAIFISVEGSPFTGGEALPCDGKRACVLLFKPGAARAVVAAETCNRSHSSFDTELFCDVQITHLAAQAGVWKRASAFDTETMEDRKKRRADAIQALRAGTVEVRTVSRRQLFVGGEPNGDLFE